MEKYINKAKKIVESRYFKVAFYGTAMLVFAGIIFAAGVGVVIHKARYSYQWGENYQRNFGGPDRGDQGPRSAMQGGEQELRGMPDFEGRNIRNAHGIAGQIVSVVDNNVVVNNKDNKENTVTITDKTLIKSGRGDVKVTDLKTGDNVVVMGKPGENGTINADLIRVFNNNTNN